MDRYNYQREREISHSSNPSFSSTLLDAIYRSIDQGDDEIVLTMRKKQSNNMEDFQKTCMIEKWMEQKVSEKVVARRKSTADFERKSRNLMNSSSSSSDSSCGGVFSSSETESSTYNNVVVNSSGSSSSCYGLSRPKPIRTSISAPNPEKFSKNQAKPLKTYGGFRHNQLHMERDFVPKTKSETGFVKTKSKALKIYGDLKKVKQPISPGGRLASFLNSLFTAGNTKKPKVVSSNSGNASSTCSSASSFSRSCLSKSTPKSSSNGTKRSVRFYPVSVIVDEDCQPCGHKNLYEEKKPNSESVRSLRNSINAGHLAAGRNGVKRLRTVRHPNILSFLHSTETENFDGSTAKVTIYVVTEPVMPLSEKLKELGLKGTQRDEYYAWGLHRIAKAVSFLNNDCKLVHGNVCLASVVVTQTLDWKLHAFDVLSEFDGHNESAVGPMLQYDWLIGAQYKSKELAKSDWTTIRKSPPWAIDSWGLGCLIYELFSGTKLSKTEDLCNTASIPKSLLPDYQRLLSSMPPRRLNSSKLLENSEYFQNKLVETIQFMEILNLKDSVEKDTFFRKLPNLAEQLPREIVLKKLLPLLASALEFGSAAAPALTALLKMGSWLSTDEFSVKVLPTIIKLFASNDRSIRVGLLQHIDQYGESLSAKIVDEQVYAHVATGFSDTSAFLRELTLKSMLILAPKLSHRTISGSLLKYLSKLQVDEEPAIRTNTTILLGNIAGYLNEGTRKRVLINALTVRALRDTFAPARAAGIMALSATSSYYDVTEIATRILPNIVVFTIDPDSDVQSKAFKAVDQFLQLVKQHHEKTSTGNTSTTSMETSSTPGNPSLLGWAMSSLTLKGGKSSEQGPYASASSSMPPTSAVPDSSSIADSSSITPIHVSSSTDMTDQHVPVSASLNDGWGELENEIVEDFDGDKDGWDDNEPQEEPKPSPFLANIQAAQKRPVSQPKPQVTSLRGSIKNEDEDPWGSVPASAPAPRTSSQPSSTRSSRTVDDDDDPWGAISAPAPSAKPLNVKKGGALDDNDPWAAIAAPVPTSKVRPSAARGRGNKPTVPKLGAQRINRTSSGM